MIRPNIKYLSFAPRPLEDPSLSHPFDLTCVIVWGAIVCALGAFWSYVAYLAWVSR